MIKATAITLFGTLLSALQHVNAAPEADLSITARTVETVASDCSAVYYANSTISSPLLIGNDKGAASGGLRAFALEPDANNGTLAQTAHRTPGRTGVLTTVYGVGEWDLVITIASPDSLARLYDADTLEPVGGGDGALTKVLGAWSALCAWKSSESGEQYVYLFGKGLGIQFLLRSTDDGTFELVEVQTFDTPVEASACAVSLSAGKVYFSGDDNPTVYSFAAAESTTTPAIDVLGQAADDVTGLVAYIGVEQDYLLVAQTDIVGVYDERLELLGSLTLSGDEDIEVHGLSVYQAVSETYPAGALAYALESEIGEGFGASSLESAFEALNLTLNTAYDPRRKPCKLTTPITDACIYSGFTQEDGSCSCFAGFAGATCETFTCQAACSGHGECVGANSCDCETGWGGLYCGFKVVEATEETDAFGGDGDDPAIWIHPTDKSQSRIITTIKSEEGAGFAVFYLNGTTAQTISAGEPDNVDIIYGFQAGNRTVDLAYAACRDDNTLW